MIFVTVGAQMPFDRLIRAVDAWAGRSSRSDVFAQIGPSALSPTNIQWTRFLEPEQFRQKVAEADIVVAHAGMGSILTALTSGKPILVMPRRGDLKETRNDHQFATARQLQAQGRVAVALDENGLTEHLDNLQRLSPSRQISRQASPQLLQAIREFVQHSRLGAAKRPVGVTAAREASPAVETAAWETAALQPAN
jgi:UDP-N-acetylglucosamine transferase subunit ALG13